jgi:hypothetical protein
MYERDGRCQVRFPREGSHAIVMAWVMPCAEARRRRGRTKGVKCGWHEDKAWEACRGTGKRSVTPTHFAFLFLKSRGPIGAAPSGQNESGEIGRWPRRCALRYDMICGCSAH